MTRAALVLRPEPGNARTAARLATHGIAAICRPLFAVSPVAWMAPDPARFDALMLTSANAVRTAGPELDALRQLPVLAVGASTGAAALAAGLEVVLTGDGGVEALLATARARGFARLLHLAGRDRVVDVGVEAITVYASEPVPIPPGTAPAWEGRIALLHSARAARRFAALVDRDSAARSQILVVALSPAVLDAAGQGWAGAEVADAPTDAALVALAASLIDRADARADKRRR